MTAVRLGVLGAGAAGGAAAKTLRDAGLEAEIDLIARTSEQPVNRTLVNKGIAVGLLAPEQAALPDAGVNLVKDTVRGITPRNRQVHLDSGATREYDGLIVATGSRPRALGVDVLGQDEAATSGRLTSLHSVNDAIRVRDRIASLGQPARIIMLGGGLLASETASLLAVGGNDVALISRSPVPGATAFGEYIATAILELHRARGATYLGHTVMAIRTHSDRITVILDNDEHIEGDLAIIAHGTVPAAPSPWNGPDGVPVSSRLRLREVPGQRIYAAGGVASHTRPGIGEYRIDHWNDAVAQGTHAARSLLHDLDCADDPGTYLPVSMFTSSIHGRILAGAGHSGHRVTEQLVSTDPVLVTHTRDGVPVAATGLDAVAEVHQWAARLHQTPETQIDARPEEGQD
ncbi:FAD-dependent oxidoreductase [Corynebacterium glyciniphilum]|uniref:FAD-dependent oxidoreductase n=1 Tax=Corynebacterium glyciniphilum TaxID=1404244 RepID=UPI003DA0C895